MEFKGGSGFFLGKQEGGLNNDKLVLTLHRRSRKSFAEGVSALYSNLSEPLRPQKNIEACQGMTVPWRQTNEALALGTEGLRRMWSALAPNGSNGRSVLLKMLLPSVKFSSSEREASGRTSASVSAGFCLLCEPWV